MIALRKVLIANRGEIACRVIRTARRLGMRSVAVCSEADRGALHTVLADEVVEIGASPASESYLRIDRIIAAAKASGADCIHPGYGFLAENPELAEACESAGLVFVGPTADAMRALGGKAAAKEIAIAAGVPVVPGYQGTAQAPATLQREAARIGWPVMIKAVAGGGGRGMRMVERAADFAGLLESAQREAVSAFGDARVLIEKVVQRPRHIEVQVFGDSHGNAVHLFERDCSLQRRNQKVIEEAPAPGMTAELRAAICTAAVKLAREVGYRGAGTVEFLVEGGGLDAAARWYFIEMNTRLQVEHPVTEEITGLDLVEWQLRVAAGEPLPLSQAEVKMHGHAIELRLCAEDPAKGFMPSIGRLAAFDMPEVADVPGLRVEAGVRCGDEISPHYDSMIAKLIVAGADRQSCIDGLITTLQRATVAGLPTNAAFLAALLRHDDVVAGRMDTGLIGRDPEQLSAAHVSTLALEEGARGLIEDRMRAAYAVRAGSFGVDPAQDGWSGAAAPPGLPHSPWDATDGFQLGPDRSMRYGIEVDGTGREFEARWCKSATAPGRPVLDASRDAWSMPPLGPDAVHLLGFLGLRSDEPSGPSGFIRQIPDAGRRFVISNLVQATVAWPLHDPDALTDGEAGNAIRVPINGKVAKLLVAAGDDIEKGARIAIVEAMKMEHVVHASRAGTISRLSVHEGQQVVRGGLIAELAPEGST